MTGISSPDLIRFSQLTLSKTISDPDFASEKTKKATPPGSSSTPVTPVDRPPYKEPPKKFHRKRQIFKHLGFQSEYNFENGTSLYDKTSQGRLYRVVSKKNDFIGMTLRIQNVKTENYIDTEMLFPNPCKITLEYPEKSNSSLMKVTTREADKTAKSYLIALSKSNDIWITTLERDVVTFLIDKTGLFKLSRQMDGDKKLGHSLQLLHEDGSASEIGLLFHSGTIRVEYNDDRKATVKVTQQIPGIFWDTFHTFIINLPGPVDKRFWISC